MGAEVSAVATHVAVRDAGGAPHLHSGAEPAAVLGRLRAAGEAVLAVPASWYAPGGAKERERVCRLVADHGWRVRSVVPRWAATVAAYLGAGNGPGGGIALAVELTPDGITLTLARVAGGVVEALEPAPVAVPMSPGLRRLTDAAASAPDGGGARRASVLLARAREVPRYRDTPAYRGAGAPTAGAALEAFGPVAAAISRCAAVPAAAGVTHVFLDGPLAAVALVEPAIRAARPDWAVAELTRTAAGTAASGALLLAEGRCTAPRPAPYSVHLPVRRVRAGRLVSDRLQLAQAGEEPPVAPAAGAAPVTVRVPEGNDRPIVVELADGPGTPARIELAASRLPAGSYRVGLWPVDAGPGVLAFRPDGPGAPVLMPLPNPQGVSRGR
jgi:hypothetical protein